MMGCMNAHPAPGADIGSAIRRRRQILGWEQKELADRVGVHVNSVQKWESGEHYPRRKLGRLEEVLGISLDSTPPPEPEIPPGVTDAINDHIKPEFRAAALDAVRAALRGEPYPPPSDPGEGAHGGRSTGRTG